MTPAEHLEQLHIFASYMLGTRDEALAVIGEVLDQHPGDPANWLRALVAPFMLKKKTHRVDRFGELDEILRTHSTIPVDLSHPLVRGDIRRLNVLLAELQRTCLLTTLRGLTVERRVVFILRHVLGLSVEACADVCGTTPTGINVADVRGRQDLENYLGVRCEHLDAGNTCHCVSRLGNALHRGLVSWPEGANINADYRHGINPRPFSNVISLYVGIPRLRLHIVG